MCCHLAGFHQGAALPHPCPDALQCSANWFQRSFFPLYFLLWCWREGRWEILMVIIVTVQVFQGSRNLDPIGPVWGPGHYRLPLLPQACTWTTHSCRLEATWFCSSQRIWHRMARRSLSLRSRNHPRYLSSGLTVLRSSEAELSSGTLRTNTGDKQLVLEQSLQARTSWGKGREVTPLQPCPQDEIAGGRLREEGCSVFSNPVAPVLGEEGETEKGDGMGKGDAGEQRGEPMSEHNTLLAHCWQPTTLLTKQKGSKSPS